MLIEEEEGGATNRADDPNPLLEIWDDPDFSFVVQTMVYVRRGKPVEVGPDQLLVYGSDGAIDRVIGLGVGGASWLFGTDVQAPACPRLGLPVQVTGRKNT